MKDHVCPKCMSINFFDRTTRINGRKSMTILKCLKCGHISEEVQATNENVIREVLPNQNERLID